MKYNKVILAGGTGYLGTVLAAHFKPLAKDVFILTRHPQPSKGNVHFIEWTGRDRGHWMNLLEDADLLVNLCGKNVNCRYTEKNKETIFSSRTEPTLLLGSVISEMDAPPRAWINVASATIYRHAEDYGQDEYTGQVGYGFSVDVCKKWEKAFMQYDTPLTKKVILRMAIVLGNGDGVFPRLVNLVRFGLGGRQGDGNQIVSWIHEQDAARVIEWLADNKCEGVYNCSAPTAVRNKDLMRSLRKASGIPAGLPSPQWLLEIGALLIGTETELVLKSRWVLPTRLEKEGFKFLFSDATHAIHDLLSTTVK